MTEEDFLLYASFSMNTLSAILMDLETAFVSVKAEYESMPEYHPRKMRARGLTETYRIIIEIVTRLLEIKKRLITKDELYAMLQVHEALKNGR